uniref:XIAP-associated factor 1-like n=1 Tax=Oncorhynchus gorbuscha TaxID=8017 RepID=UPI001EAF24B2|nr:XIAP-associated factor 1-like [Oncorhynchus gorbuscha]
MADKEEERTRICDQCHKEVAVSNFALHEAHCQRFLYLCPDCDEPVPRELLEQHHQNQHSQVKCTKCDKKAESRQLLDHECKARLQHCEFCLVELPLSAMAEHSLACGSRTERCSDCGRYITLRDQPEHGQICPDLNAPDNPSPPSSNGRRTAVVCRSCTRSFPLEEMEEHQLECDHTSESSIGDDDDEEDGSHKQEQASPRLTSSMKSTLFSAQGKRQEGEVDQISTCPHCHLALPVVTLRWHEVKCQIHVNLK